jgi:cell division protein FtsX
MNPFLFLFRELLGAIRARSALFFALTGLLLFVFLAVVGTFFLVPSASLAEAAEDGSLPIEEIQVRLSPRLSSATVDRMYLDIRARQDVERVVFRFSQELDRDASGGVLVIRPMSPDAASELVAALRSLNGVTEVIERRSQGEPDRSPLSTAARIGLLSSLVLTIALSLFFARIGYRELLRSFAGEIRLLRLSGISERTVVPLTVGIGILIGFLAGLLLLVILYVLHYVVVSQGGTSPAILAGLASGGRILGVSLVNLFLGLVLGGLIGLYGASLLGSREFHPIP